MSVNPFHYSNFSSTSSSSSSSSSNSSFPLNESLPLIPQSLSRSSEKNKPSSIFQNTTFNTSNITKASILFCILLSFISSDNDNHALIDLVAACSLFAVIEYCSKCFSPKIEDKKIEPENQIVKLSDKFSVKKRNKLKIKLIKCAKNELNLYDITGKDLEHCNSKIKSFVFSFCKKINKSDYKGVRIINIVTQYTVNHIINKIKTDPILNKANRINLNELKKTGMGIFSSVELKQGYIDRKNHFPLVRDAVMHIKNKGKNIIGFSDKGFIKKLIKQGDFIKQNLHSKPLVGSQFFRPAFCRLSSTPTFAVFSLLSKLSAILRIKDMFSGMCPARAFCSSSRKATSKSQ